MAIKRSFSSRDSDSTLDVPYESMARLALQSKKRRLRRLPHVFSKVLVLPLITSDAHVSTEEQPHCFRFAAKDDSFTVGLDVWSQILEDHLGVKKLTIARAGGVSMDGDSLGHDKMRFRLPSNACLEAAKVVCGDGELVVIVPKRGG